MKEGVLFIFLLILFVFVFLHSRPVKFESVVIVGTAKNIGSYVPKITKKIEDVLTLFKRGHVILYENDSTDDTLQLLQKWGRAKILSEKGITGKRTHVLAHARNVLLEEALQLDTEYIIVMDLDDVNLNLTKESVLTSLHNPETDWAVMGANQEWNYYDLWALRTFDDWTPCDIWNDAGCKIVKKNIPTRDPLLHVKSCFGGFAVYKTKYLHGCTYDGILNETGEKCEHVSLNTCITDKGGKIYINPKMINS